MAEFDYHSALPAEFQPFKKTDTGLVTNGTFTQSAWTPSKGDYQPRWMVRHCVYGLDAGRSDNVIVTVKWKTTSIWDTIGQVGPVLGLASPENISQEDPLKLGWGPVWDIGLGGAWYYLNVFSAPPAELLASNLPEEGNSHVWRYNADLPADGEQSNRSSEIFSNDEQIISLIAMNGHVCVTWNNDLISREYKRPEWTKNSTWFGVRCIDIKPPPGHADLNVDTWRETGSLVWDGAPLGEPQGTEVSVSVELVDP